MLQIRPATEADLETIIRFIRELAAYEKLSHQVTLDPDRLKRELFGPTPYAWTLIAEWNHEPAGFAVCCYTFSTFLGKHGVYIEDVFVLPDYRGKKIGQSLMRSIARRAIAEGCERMDWEVLDWNEPSLEFYKRLGAQERSDWLNYRVEGAALAALAADDEPATP